MLTPLQRKTLIVIQQHFETCKKMPTRRELSTLIHGNLNASNAQRLIEGLEDRGFIRTVKNKPRSIEILRPITPKTEYYTYDSKTEKFTKLQTVEARSD